MKKRAGGFFAAIISLAMLLNMNSIAVAEDAAIKVLLDGKTISFDQPPIIVDGRTLVPMRAIFEAMGATIVWDSETQTITGKKDDIVIIMQIGNTIIMKNGQSVVLDVPPQIVNSRTLVPARAVAESLNAEVAWNSVTQTVSITSSPDSTISSVPSELLYKWKGILNGRLSVYEFKPDGILTISTLGQDISTPFIISGNRLTLLWENAESQTADFELSENRFRLLFPSGESMDMTKVDTAADNDTPGSELNGYYWEGWDSGIGFVYEFLSDGKGVFYAGDAVITFAYSVENNIVTLDFGDLIEPGRFAMEKVGDTIVLIDHEGVAVTLIKLS